MEVIKISGKSQPFNVEKIYRAIRLANKSVPEESRMSDATIDKVVNNVLKMLDGFTSVSVDDIHDLVERALMKFPSHYQVAKEYITYRDQKKKNKKFNEIEEQVLAVIDGSSTLRGDNANKKIDTNSALRDYIAGITCKSISKKVLPKKILNAHTKGLIHWHDMDYSPTQPLHNCDLLNIEDMFKNGFQMGDTRIEPNEDTPFETACNLLAQVNLQVSGSQYGGQTVSWSHLLPFIENSRRLIRKNIIEDYWESDKGQKLKNINKIFGTSFKPYNENDINKLVEKKLRAEIYKGVKTYQYQVLCHQSSNGQTPFVSNNLCLREAKSEQELKDFAMLIEEILKRRIKGVKDSSGHYVSPLFPKLLYWTCDGLNVKPGDPYYYLTELAAECELKRTQPDIVSEKETRRVKKGQIIPSMGCRSLLGPIWEEHTYPINTKFQWVEGLGIENFDINTADINVFNKLSFDYSNLVDERSFEGVKNDNNILVGRYRINFRGNTGWLIEKTDTEVKILEPKVYGRWNNGVITINIPHIGLEARTEVLENCKLENREFPKNDLDTMIINRFFEKFEERLQLVREGLIIRNNHCKTIKAKNSPILWMYGGLSRLESEQTVGELMDMYPQRPTISFGFVGLYETCQALINESNTTDNGRELSIKTLQFMNDKCNEWKKIDNINYAIYGTPEESLTYKFALANRRDFGLIEHITDKDYVVNSYHVDPREEIDAFSKIEIEGEYLALSSGGAVSYIELMDHTYNKEAIISIIQWMHEHIVYAEFNKKLAVCHVCGHEGGIELIKTEDGEFKFVCPNCGNTDDSKMNIVARICGYLGQVNAGNTNKGRLDDIYHRVIHTDCKSEF